MTLRASSISAIENEENQILTVDVFASAIEQQHRCHQSAGGYRCCSPCVSVRPPERPQCHRHHDRNDVHGRVHEFPGAPAATATAATAAATAAAAAAAAAAVAANSAAQDTGYFTFLFVKIKPKHSWL